MTVRGPATTGIPLNIRIHDYTIIDIDAHAEAADVSRAEMIRILLNEALSNRARKAARRVGK